jgi:NDP-sugar pyrophosphorylase family protein
MLLTVLIVLILDAFVKRGYQVNRWLAMLQLKSMQGVSGVILAAGKGTRIGGSLPKVLNPIAGKPMIHYSLELLKKIPVSHIFTVVGYKSQDVIANVSGRTQVVFQEEQLGTAHAVHQVLKVLEPHNKYLLVVNGDDSAFYEVSTLRTLIRTHINTKSVVSFLTADVPEPTGLGRVVRDADAQLVKVVEEKEATEEEKKITEVNIGCYIFSVDWLMLNIDKVGRSESGEYYITDLLGMAIDTEAKISTITIEDQREWMGVNTIPQLAVANDTMIERLMRRKKPKVFFFDIDHTLLNVMELKKSYSSIFQEMLAMDFVIEKDLAKLTDQFWETYRKIEANLGYVSIPETCEAFAEAIGVPNAAPVLKSLFLSLPFAAYLYPDAVELLEYCSKLGQVVIISSGDNVYQPVKVQALGIDEYVSDQFVYQVKLEHIPEFFKIYKEYEQWSINDNIQEQEAFELHNPAIKTVLVSQGGYTHLKPLDMSYQPTYTANSLYNVKQIIRKELE